MARRPKGRPGFRDWINEQSDTDRASLPLTHVTKGIIAEDIIRDGFVTPTKCGNFKRRVAYMFYGKPAYRASGDGPVRSSAACPFCFVFSPAILDMADSAFPFDTGAFFSRKYTQTLLDEINVDDFAIEIDRNHPNKIIRHVFGGTENYINSIVDGDALGRKAEDWEFLAKAYLELITATNRNEPDDRIAAIEVLFGQSIPIWKKNLIAVIVPDILWGATGGAPWIRRLVKEGIEVLPYHFNPGRSTDYYYAFLEAEIVKLYRDKGFLT